MTETYYRVNFSSATSQKKTYDKDGNRLAILDIQLPGPLLDPERKSANASVIMTKASIPLSMLPRASVTIDAILEKNGNTTAYTYYSFYYGNYIYSKHFYNVYGKALYSNGAVRQYDPFYLQYIYWGKHSFEVEQMLGKSYEYMNLQHLENDLNRVLADAAKAHSNTYKYSPIRIHFENNSIRLLFQQILALPEGTTAMTPWYGTDYDTTDNNHFCLCMSKEMATIFHNLPLIDAYDLYTEEMFDDVDFYRTWARYILDLEGRVPDGYYTDNLGEGWYYFDFHFFNPISLSPFTSIVVYSQDMPMISQIHGFTSENNQGTTATQISTLPIIEVFYPLIAREEDFYDVLIISKDTVSDGGPAKVNTNALTQYRNFTFTVGYVTKDGALHTLKIPNNSNLSFQFTFIID